MRRSIMPLVALCALPCLSKPVIFAPKQYVDSKYEESTNFAANAAADAVTKVGEMGFVKSGDVSRLIVAATSGIAETAANALTKANDNAEALAGKADATTTYTKDEVDKAIAKATPGDYAAVPTKVSQLENDSGFITSETNFDSWVNGTSIAAGKGAEVDKTNASTAYGSGAKAKSGSATAIGCNATANTYSTSVGTVANASGLYSAAIGRGTTASGRTSLAIGYGSTAAGCYSMSIGDQYAKDYSILIGWLARGSSTYAVALGYDAYVGGDCATAVGYSADAVGKNSTALGTDSVASGNWSTAIGRKSYAKEYCIGFPYDAKHFLLESSATNSGATARTLKSYFDEKQNRYKIVELSSSSVVGTDACIYSLEASSEGVTVVLPANDSGYSQDFVIRLACPDEAGTQISGISDVELDFPNGDLTASGSLKGTNYVTFTQVSSNRWCVGYLSANK